MKIIRTSSEDTNIDPMKSIVGLGENFQVPLDNTGVYIVRLPEEFHKMLLQETKSVCN